MNDKNVRGARDHVLLARALELVPSRSVLKAAARPTYSHVRTSTHGWRSEEIYKRGFILAERQYWDHEGKNAILTGHRLVLLVTRELVLQRLSGTRTSEGDEEWRASSATATVGEVLDLWTVNELLQGIDEVLRLTLEAPRRLVCSLRTTRDQLLALQGKGP